MCGADGAAAEAFVSGAAVRVYNERRSSLWRVEKVDREGSQVRLQLDRTSLAASGPVSRMEDGVVYLAAGLPLATSSIDSQGLSIRQDAYAGMVLESGNNAARIEAATQPGDNAATSMKSVVADPAAAAVLDAGGADAYAGMVLEGGNNAARIDAATQPGVVVLAEPVPVSRLKACTPDGVARIYEYGVGDSLELARVEVRTTGG